MCNKDKEYFLIDKNVPKYSLTKMNAALSLYHKKHSNNTLKRLQNREPLLHDTLCNTAINQNLSYLTKL